MLETIRQNFDGGPIVSRMNKFKDEVGGLAKCYGERRPSSNFPHGTVLVGLAHPNKELEETIDKIAAENGGLSPAGWHSPDSQVAGFSFYRSINGYRFT